MKRLSQIIYILLIALGTEEMVKGILQLFHKIPSENSLYPITGSFFNPGPFGCFIAMIIPVALFCYQTEKSKLLRYSGLAYILIAIFPLATSLSRTGWIAAIAGSIVVTLGIYKHNILTFYKSNKTQFFYFFVMGFVSLIGITVWLYNMKTQSALGRLFIWKIGLRTLLNTPLFGIGPDFVAGALGDNQEKYFQQGFGSDSEILVAGAPEYVFNEYLQIGIAFGIGAMLLFIAILAIAFFSGWRNANYGLTGALVALAIICFASYPFQFGIFILSAALIIFGLLINPKFKSYTATICTKILAAIILTIALTACYYWHQRLESEQEWKNSRWIYRNKLYSQTVTKYQELRQKPIHNHKYLFELGHALYQIGNYEDSNKILFNAMRKSSDPMILNIIGKNYMAMNDTANAHKFFLKASHRTPSRLYPHYLLMKMYRQYNYIPGMKSSALHLINTKEKIPSPAVNDMKKEAMEILDSINNYY